MCDNFENCNCNNRSLILDLSLDYGCNLPYVFSKLYSVNKSYKCNISYYSYLYLC